jgi:predicted house-cleaning noncanonical NTP pyrophosphatase (MazG superfamily)
MALQVLQQAGPGRAYLVRQAFLEEPLMGYKMVRDNHQELLGEHLSGQWRVSPDPVSALVKKLGEEYSELAESRDPGELYDVRDVLEELITLLDPDRSAERKHDIKMSHLGRFSDHVEWHPNPDIDLWAEWADR